MLVAFAIQCVAPSIVCELYLFKCLSACCIGILYSYMCLLLYQCGYINIVDYVHCSGIIILLCLSGLSLGYVSVGICVYVDLWYFRFVVGFLL